MPEPEDAHLPTSFGPEQPNAEPQPESLPPLNVTQPSHMNGDSLSVAGTPEVVPTQPASPGPVVFSAVSGQTDGTSVPPNSANPSNLAPQPWSSLAAGSASKKRRKRFMIGVSSLAVALLLAAGYAFGFYLPNTPGHVFSAGLANSGKAVDLLIKYSQRQQQKQYKSASFAGMLHVKSPSVSFDVNLSGYGGGNAFSAHSSADVLGKTIAVDALSVPVPNEVEPDLYLRVSGIKDILDRAGVNGAKVDGKWIVIDHTLLDTYAKNLAQSKSQYHVQTFASTSGIPTYAEEEDAITKVQAVNKQYLFTTDAAKAVLVNEQFLGHDTLNGRSQDHYKVGYNKAHLAAYFGALGSALDSSQLNNWAKANYSGKDVSQVLNISAAQAGINKAKGDYTFDLWVDTKTKLVSKLSFADTTTKTTVSLMQAYTGGTQYPFTISVTGQDSSGEPQSASLGLTLNTATNKLAVTLAYNSGNVAVSGNLSISASKNSVLVTAPTGATPLLDELRVLDPGGGLPLATGTSKLQSASPITLPTHTL